MTETPDEYTTDRPEISSEARQLAEDFTTAINSFHWRSDYLKFCEALVYTPDDWAQSKYRQFQELINYLGCFDQEAIARMLEAGK